MIDVPAMAGVALLAILIPVYGRAVLSGWATSGPNFLHFVLSHVVCL